MSAETLSSWVEQKEGVNRVKDALNNLEKSVRWQYFKKAVDWLKSTFWLEDKDAQKTALQQVVWQWSGHTEQPSSGIDYSKVDRSWFTPWPYPFAHIHTPYKGISTYRVDNIKLNPLIWFSQLWLSWTEGNLVTLHVKDQPLKFTNKDAVWVKKNNPCNVSPFKGDVWRTWSSRVADGQNHWRYNTMEDGLASFMRLMRQDRYRNKSIQGINCSWMQWIYKPDEPDSLKALRIKWITHSCEKLHVSPFERLNTDDKETMMAFTQQTAVNETWTHFDRATLERAYEKAFW